MGSAMITGNRVIHAMRMWMRGLGRAVHAGSHRSGEQPVVFAVSNCYPTRIVLYAAAFQANWNLEFVSSLDKVLAASRSRRPKVVFYDHACGLAKWDQCCSALASERIPFILLARKASDETFMRLLACGGYHAWGDPLNSEDLIKALDLAEEVDVLSRAPVG
jgi:hypothetical protein